MKRNNLGDVERLSRSLRGTQLTLVLVVSVACLVAWKARGGPVEATEFRLVNDAGAYLGSLSTDEIGRPTLLLKGAGKSSIILGFGKDGGFLGTSNKDGEPVATLRMLDGGGSLSLRSSDAKNTAHIDASDGSAGVYVNSREPECRAAMTASKDTGASAVLQSAKGGYSSVWGQAASGELAIGFLKDGDIKHAFPSSGW